jgi:hypothetical protein
MNIFIAIGTATILASYAYMPWQKTRDVMHKPLPGIFEEYRSGRMGSRPAWSWAILALGVGLCVLGYWRQWSGQ